MFALQDDILYDIFLKKAVRKFSYAFAGLLDGIHNDASIRLQFVLGVCTLLAGLLLHLSLIELEHCPHLGCTCNSNGIYKQCD